MNQLSSWLYGEGVVAPPVDGNSDGDLKLARGGWGFFLTLERQK